MKIRAAISSGISEPFVLGDAELEEPRADEVLVRVEACGICHTDLRFKDELWPAERFPMVFGHEGAGTVEAVGRSVNGLAPGDKVVLSFDSCGECRTCRSGKVAYCERLRQMNFSGSRSDGSTQLSRDDGPLFGSFFGQSSFASHILATERNAVKVPADIDLELAAPLGCGIQTGAGVVANVFRPDPSQSVVVFGAGAVGDAAVMAAAAVGMSTVIAVEPVASRRELALQIGASAAIDPGSSEVVEEIRELTDGGADFAFDTSGRRAVISTAINALTVNGMLALVASETPEVSVDLFALSGRSIRGVVEGDAVPHRSVPWLLDLHAKGQLPLEKIVRRYPYQQINAAAEDTLAGETVKAVITF